MCLLPSARSHSSMDIRAIIEFIAKLRENVQIETGMIFGPFITFHVTIPMVGSESSCLYEKYIVISRRR